MRSRHTGSKKKEKKKNCLTRTWQMMSKWILWKRSFLKFRTGMYMKDDTQSVDVLIAPVPRLGVVFLSSYGESRIRPEIFRRNNFSSWYAAVNWKDLKQLYQRSVKISVDFFIQKSITITLKCQRYEAWLFSMLAVLRLLPRQLLFCFFGFWICISILSQKSTFLRVAAHRGH